MKEHEEVRPRAPSASSYCSKKSTFHDDSMIDLETDMKILNRNSSISQISDHNTASRRRWLISDRLKSNLQSLFIPKTHYYGCKGQKRRPKNNLNPYKNIKITNAI